MEETNRFSEKKVIQIHENEFTADEILILCMMSEIGYTVLRSNKLRSDTDIFFNIGNLWDGVKYFDCPTRMIMEKFVESFYFKEYVDKIFKYNTSALGSKLAVELTKSTQFRILNVLSEDYTKSGDLFEEALRIAKVLLERKVQLLIGEFDAKDLIKKAVKEAKNNKVLVLKETLPWNKYFSYINKFTYIIYPVLEKWRLYCIPESKTYGRTGKKKLPRSWINNKPEGAVYIDESNRTVAEFISLESVLASVLTL